MALPQLVSEQSSKENRQAVYGIEAQDGHRAACEPMALNSKKPSHPSACADFPEHRSVYRLVRLLLPMT